MADGHGLNVTFYIDSLKSEFKSEQAGRPIHEDKEFICIMIPGDNKTVVKRLAEAPDIEKFPIEYARFKNGLKDAEQQVGTPLSQWPAMSRSMVKDMGALNIYTVEQLANLSDTGKQAFGMGANEWSEKAKAYLANAASGAAEQKYAAENVALRRDINELRKQLAELSASVEPKRGPGRPRNEAA